MIESSILSASFSDWAQLAEYTVGSSRSGVVMVANAGGEIRFSLRTEDLGHSLARAERSEAESFVMSSAWADDVERYLTVELGGVIRQRSGLGAVRIPWKESELAAGFEIRRIDPDLLELVDDSGRRAVFFDHGMPHPIVEFSHYANAPLEEIRASMVDPAGAPFFDS